MMNEQEKEQNSMDTEEFMKNLIADIDKDFREYNVHSGDQVTIQTDGKYVVSHVLMQGPIEAALNDKKIWGLFCLVSVTHGGIYAEPVPVMSEGSVDLRRLVAPHVTVEYKKTVGKVRHYQAVMLRDGYKFFIKVKGR